MKIQTIKNRQVRQGTFETNSSSTHAVTIQTIGGRNKEAPKPIVEDNVLYPKRLCGYTIMAGESSATCCNTKDMKAAMVCNWIFTSTDNWSYGSATGQVQAWINKWVDYVADKLDYASIDRNFEYFYPAGEYDDNLFPIDDESDDESDDEAIADQLDYLIGVILDDTKEIVDSNAAY